MRPGSERRGCRRGRPPDRPRRARSRRRRLVAGRPIEPWDLRVADVADEGVPERVLVLACHRGRLGRDGPAPCARDRASACVTSTGPGRPSPPACPPRTPCRPLPRPGAGSCVCGQRIEAGGDDRLDRRGHLRLGPPSIAPVGEQADELLGVQGVAARPLQELLHRRAGSTSAAAAGDEPAGLGLVERRQVDPLRVAGVRAERRMAFVELGPGGAQEQERQACDPVGQVLDEREEGVVRPVQVLEHQHGRSLGGETLDEAPPGRERFLERRGLAPVRRRGARAWREASLAPGPPPARRSARAWPPPPGAVRLQDPALRLDDLAQRPERDALAVREASTLAPADESWPIVHLHEELGAQSALADARLADDRHKLARRLLHGPRECPAEHLPLELAADHRRLGGRVTSEPRRARGRAAARSRAAPPCP